MGQSGSRPSASFNHDRPPQPARAPAPSTLPAPANHPLTSSRDDHDSTPHPRRQRTPRPRPHSINGIASLFSHTSTSSQLDRPRRTPLHRARSSFASLFPRPPNDPSPAPDSSDRAVQNMTLPPTLPDLNFSEEELTIESDLPPPPPPPASATPPRTRPASPSGSRRSISRPIGSIADRIQSLTPDRGFRSLVRRRRSPARGQEDHNATLSRMLSVAAAATAASLVGSNSEDTINAVRNTVASIEGDDGNFERFLQALRSGRLNSLLSPDGSNSLQFFRVFQFGNAARLRENEGTRPASTRSRLTSSRSSPDSAVDDSDREEGRLVPVLMIGIRSLNGDSDSGSDANDAMVPSFFDAFGNFEQTDRQNLQDAPALNNLLRPGRNGVNFSQRRRASMGGLGLFSSNRGDSNRRSHRASDASNGEPASDYSSPSGPYPPPTTPSSPPLSSLPSGASTPSRRTSASSMARRASSVNPDRDFHHRSAHTALESTAEEPIGTPRPTRARRLSESDFMRYGSGSSRRNGVVEPDHAPADRDANRSWIIYVLGGSYPENHPILTTPSLFTDSPTYEDMLLLSSMLGPAKPPVATKEDILNAGGLYSTRVGEGNSLQLVGGDPIEYIPLNPNESCLVCLSDFVPREVVRRLHQCSHVFHQICIDEWLMTGRNCCPLCRGQGVEESSPESSSSQRHNQPDEATSLSI